MKWASAACQPQGSFAVRARSALAVVAAVALLGLVFAGPAAASGPSFVQAFGLNVGGAGVDLCTTTCQQGSMGDAAGEFNDAAGVAVSGSGDVYVADTYNNRIEEFSQSGSFVRAFGLNVGGTGVDVCTSSCQAGSVGSAAGELAYPGGVAVAGSGDVYVADGDNSRIDEFSPSGSFLEAFGLNVGGAGVDVCTTSCQAGSTGSAAGELYARTVSEYRGRATSMSPTEQQPDLRVQPVRKLSFGLSG